uniref:50S ribosomal protein L18 n=1 Tax=Anthurium amnicola TaxID=1678845 RepID=A0A1D1ZHZ6_9ARAE
MALPSPSPLRSTAAVPTPRPVHILTSPRGGGGTLSLSWASSFPDAAISSSALRPIRSPSPLLPLPRQPQVGIVRAAWTRRSRSEAAKRPSRKSWKQRTDMYMRPFLLNVFFSNRFIHAKVMHRGTSKVISVASTNAKDLRNSLPSLIDNDACRTIGKLIAERSKEADVFAMAFEPRKGEKIEGKLGIVIDTIKENGIIFVE